MKHVVNFFKGIIIGAWLLIAIISTICLICRNEFKVSTFGDYSLFVIDSEELEPEFEKYDLVIVKKQLESKYNEGDLTFFYEGNYKTQSYINLAKIDSIEHNEEALDNMVYGDITTPSDSVIGLADKSIVYHKIGLILNIFESRWGFMFLIILPTLFAIVYELYFIAVEVKKEAKKSHKE